jgi:nicotinamidase-related amidase
MVPELHQQWQDVNFAGLLSSGAAFVNLDSQNSILNPEGVLNHEQIWRGAREPGGCLYNTLRLAADCRAAGMPFMWLRYDRFVGEREPTTPLDRAQYAHWNAAYSGDQARKTWEADLVEDIKAILEPDDLTLVYPAWSIFVGTSVLRWLSQWQARTLILSGYHTDWCVEMAARSARDHGLVPIVVGDACGTTHPLHEQTLNQINDCYAPVVTTDFLIDAIRRSHNASIRSTPQVHKCSTSD